MEEVSLNEYIEQFARQTLEFEKLNFLWRYWYSAYNTLGLIVISLTIIVAILFRNNIPMLLSLLLMLFIGFLFIAWKINQIETDIKLQYYDMGMVEDGTK